MTKIYKDKSHSYAIKTEGANEDVFISEISFAISEYIDAQAVKIAREYRSKPEGGSFPCEIGIEWDDRLQKLLPLIVDICCKYRGYKSDVVQKIMFVAGTTEPNEDDLFCED